LFLVLSDAYKPDTKGLIISVAIWLMFSFAVAYLFKDSQYISAGDGIILDKEKGHLFRDDPQLPTLPHPL